MRELVLTFALVLLFLLAPTPIVFLVLLFGVTCQRPSA
jgi:hypothetical protein